LGIFFSIHYKNCNEEDLKKFGYDLNMPLDVPLGQTSSNYLESILSKFPDGKDREAMLQLIESSLVSEKLPTRWDEIVSAIQGFPVTICTMKLKLRYPIAIDIDPVSGKFGGITLQNNLVVGPITVLNIA
jgi:hypothetical protein